MTSTQPALRDASAITDEDGDAERDLNVVLAWTVGRFKEIVLADVDRVRRRHPELENEELARIVVRRGVRRVGWASFATGFGGAPLIAANVSSVIALQAAIVLAVAEVYGELDSPDIKRDIALMIGGDSAVQAFKQFGVVATNDFSKRWVQRNVTRETMKQVNKGGEPEGHHEGGREVDHLVHQAGAGRGRRRRLRHRPLLRAAARGARHPLLCGTVTGVQSLRWQR